MAAFVCGTSLAQDLRQRPRVPRHLRYTQRATVTHVEAGGTPMHQPLQLARDLFRVVFEGRTDGATGERDATDQDARGDQVADQRLVR
jgi:hypothetical protein